MSQITTISDLKSYMPSITLNDGQAQIAVDAVNQYIETQTHRCFGETVTVTERYNWGRTLWLRHPDVTDVASITLGYPGQVQSTVDPSSYFFNPLGRVTMYSQMFGRGTSGGFSDYVGVTYSYGLLNVPDDLKLAALGIAAGFYNWAVNGNKDIISTSVGSYRVEYSGAVRRGPTGTTSPGDTTEANFSIIRSYAVQRV